MCNKTAARSPSSAGAEHKPILAERFKTKMCQNFIKTGICPYEVRCMFAHGEHELRNKEMNLRDKLVTEDAIKNFQRAKMIADRSMERKKKRLSQAAAAESSSHAEEKEDDETNTLKQNPATPKEPSTPAVPVRKTPAHAANTPPTRPRSERRTSTSFVAALEPHAITPETPETVGSIKSPDVEGREPVPIKGLDLASPAVVSPSRRYRHDPYAPVALLPVAAAVASEPPAAVVPCVAKPQLATCRSRPLPVPPPLCAVALRDTPRTATSAPDSATRVMTPSISPLAQVMGRQASASYYNRAMPATPLVSPPVAATPAPPTPLTHVTEYKTTYGAPSIVASHAVLLA